LSCTVELVGQVSVGEHDFLDSLEVWIELAKALRVALRLLPCITDFGLLEVFKLQLGLVGQLNDLLLVILLLLNSVRLEVATLGQRITEGGL